MLPEGQKMVTRKQPISMRARNCSGKFFGSVALLLVVACLLMFSSRLKNKSETNKTGGSILNDPLALVLTPQSGDSRTDREISRLQQKIRDGRNLQLLLEQLGWAFVAKARENFDTGFYKLAEQCAQCIEKRNPQSQEAMQLAVSAASPNDAESAAWVNTRLAFYEFQAGRFEQAQKLCAFALSLQGNHAPALLLQGKMLLARNRVAEAVDALQSAAKINPLPEYQWALAEGLRARGRENEASAIEAQLRQHGAANDARTVALFLATRGESPETALRLTKEEFDSRSDIFTHDAFAWSLAAAGNLAEARREMQHALAEGTEDARLFFHAAMIASQVGDAPDAKRWLRKASDLSHLLLPSERNELQNLGRGAKQNASAGPNTQKLFRSGEIPRGIPKTKT